MTPLLRAVGVTVAGGTAYGGVFRLHETTGAPLSVIFDAVHASGGAVALDVFLREAESAGMSRSRATLKLGEAFVDTLGREAWRAVETRLASLDLGRAS